MFIINRIKFIISEQRGSIFVLAALLLPLIIAAGGLSIDMGNFYSHYARLQNTAESAANAAAIVYKNTSDEDSAIETAKRYIDMNENPDFNVYMGEAPYIKELADGSHSIRIKLYEDVPYYFLKPLFAMLGIDQKYLTISASGYCMVIPLDGTDGKDSTPGTDGTSATIFNNLFLFSDSFHAINNLGSHGDNDEQYLNNCSTYDGNIHAATAEALKKAYFDIQNIGVTSEAFKNRDKFYISDRDRNYDSRYKLDQSDAAGQVNHPFYDNDIDIASYYENYIKPMEQSNRTHILHNSWENVVRSSTINDCIARGENAIYTDSNFNNGTSLEFNIDQAISGSSSDEPFYIITEKFGNFNINADLTNSRPIILVATGENSNLRFQSSTKGFNGVLYAPYGDVYLNDNRMHFNGSVVAKNITTGEQAYYKQWDNPIKIEGTPGTPGTPGYEGNGYSHTVIYGGSENWDD